MRTIVPPSKPDLGHESEASTAPVDLTPDTRDALLEIARVALAVATGRAEPSILAQALERPEDEDERAAVFVTLTERGALRGCVGTLHPERPLRRAVVAAAISAALDDPRFAPVAAHEVPTIHIEISVLGPTRPVVDPSVFQPGIDGVIAERDGHRALLLPQVATECCWGATEMWDAVCSKAGLPADAWHDLRTRLSTFQVVRFGGPAVRNQDPRGGPVGRGSPRQGDPPQRPTEGCRGR